MGLGIAERGRVHAPTACQACPLTSFPPSRTSSRQEAQALQGKQRHLQATLFESEKKAQAAMAQQAKIDDLAAELEEVQQQQAAAAEEQELAQSRAAVVEKAYAAAIEVGGS